jgi:hypothetical protein
MDNQIDKLCFGVKPLTQTVIIGDVYKEENKYIKLLNYNNKCNVDNSEIAWNCLLNKVEIKNKNNPYVKNINSKVFFNTNQYWLFLSYDLFYFVHSYLVSIKNEYHELGYTLIKDSQRSYIHCNKDLINYFKPLELYFSPNMKISLDFKMMFECREGARYCESLFAGDEDNHKTIEFGRNFIVLFNLTLFDYEERSIKFYSEIIPISYMNYSIKDIFNISLHLINILCLIGLFFLFTINNSIKFHKFYF